MQDHEASPRARTRQARGLARMSSILDAAAEEFAEVGYERATTNAIARRAGISPGSLYQYFRDKEHLAEALARRYTERVTHSHAGAFAPLDPGTTDLPELLDRVVDPILAFHVREPGFRALFSRSDLPAALSSAVAPLERAFSERLEQLLAARAPQLAASELSALAESLVRIVRGMLAGYAGLDPAGRELRARELKAAVLAYLRHRGVR